MQKAPAICSLGVHNLVKVQAYKLHHQTISLASIPKGQLHYILLLVRELIVSNEHNRIMF
jgi:hypothetical protein